MPLASVSVSSTKPTATSRNRKRSSVSSGGSRAGARVGQAPVQALLEAHQHQRLQRGDEEQRVGDERDGDVHARPRARRRTRTDADSTTSAGSSDATAATGSTTVPIAGSVRSSPDAQATRGDEPGDDRHRVGEAQVESLRRRDVAAERATRAGASASGTSSRADAAARRRQAPPRCRLRGDAAAATAPTRRARTGRRRRRGVKSSASGRGVRPLRRVASLPQRARRSPAIAPAPTLPRRPCSTI